MAEIDALVSYVLWKILLFVFITFLMYIIFKPSHRTWIKHFRSKIQAYLLHIAMDKIVGKSKKFGDFKKSLFSKMEDKPLKIAEIGIGTGTNFAFYPEGSTVYGIEPNPCFGSYVESNRQCCGKRMKVILSEEMGEDMVSLDDNSMDVVVLCYLLCSVKDMQDVVCVLAEAKRVLKRGGSIFILQHCAADKRTWTYWIQRLINPLHKKLSDCDLLRNYITAVDQIGFSDVNLEKIQANFLWWVPIFVPHVIGICTK